MLTTAPLVAFVATANAKRAKAFYRDVLKLKLRGEDEFALVFEVSQPPGVMLRVVKVTEPVIAPYTVLGWQVDDIAATIRTLRRRRGVRFQRYKGMPQDKSGVWTSPGGAKIAWFKDPDGNTLSLTQFA